jgi:hypothetical protein
MKLLADAATKHNQIKAGKLRSTRQVSNWAAYRYSLGCGTLQSTLGLAPT